MDVQKALSDLKDETNGDKALELLHMASYFGTDEIQIDLFSDLLGDTESLNNAVELIRERSLLQFADDPNYIFINKEVQQEIQKLLKQQDQEEAVLSVAIKLLDKHFGCGRTGVVDHAMHAFKAAKIYPELVIKTSGFPTVVMRLLRDLDRTYDAYIFGRAALAVLEEYLGAHHEATFCVKTQLGMALMIMRREDEGINMLFEAHQMKYEALGQTPMDEDLKLLAQTADSASVSESRLRRLAFGWASVSVTNNNTDLNRWCEYAMVLSDLSWKDEALQILYEVLDKRRGLLSPDDDDICSVQSLIGRVHMKRGQFREALEAFQRSHEKRSFVLGENCIKTHLARRDLGLAYDALGMLDEAVSEYEDASEGISRISGVENVAYLSTLSMIAFILLRQRNYAGALYTYKVIHADYLKIVGDKNIQTLNIKYDIGGVVSNRIRPEKGLNDWKGLWPEHVEVLGITHSYTVDLIQHMCVLALYLNVCFN